jgi:hypothetical protein
MSQSSRSKPRVDRSAPASAAASGAGPGVTAVAAWCVPGAGHLLHGQTQKAAVFGVILTAMFVIGLGFGGRLFPFQVADPLVFLAAAAEWAIFVPRAVAALVGAGRGDVVAVTYEYGNAFLIASGLLNVLVTLDAVDLASGRKRR